MSKLFKEIQIVLANGQRVRGEDHLKDKLVGLYFTANWCPAYRDLTPKLKTFYDKLGAAGKNFEVLFVSSDNRITEYEECRKKQGNWASLEYNSPKRWFTISNYKAYAIPNMRIIKPDGSVIVQNAHTEIKNRGDNAEELFKEWLELYKK
ncbi:Thioredoxin domain-containing protein [Aphelenchoides bicaudatus]|nr:Thioredoxin domain-containing protein [Aphelenchoides bicaudatus]